VGVGDTITNNNNNNNNKKKKKKNYNHSNTKLKNDRKIGEERKEGVSFPMICFIHLNGFK